MSYDPSLTKSAMYSAYVNTSNVALTTQSQGGYYNFTWDRANGACQISASNIVQCEHLYSITTCDITTGGGNLCIFNFGFTNGTYRTASHIRNEYNKGDDCAVGVHIRSDVIQVDTGVFFYGSGSRNINGLDQLVGVII